MDKSFDPKEWAKTVKPAKKCITCKLEDVRLATHAVLEVMAAGKASQLSVMMMWNKWAEQYKYKHGYGAFKGHVINCEKELWLKCKKGLK